MAINVTTGEARLSYVHLAEPYAYNKEQDPRYSVTVLVPKTDTSTKARIDAAVEEAKKAGASEKWGGIIPPVVSVPLYDGDGVRPSDGMPFGDECKGHWVFTCSDKNRRPEVVDLSLNPIIDQTEIYSGMYGRVCFSVYPYAHSGKKGVGFGLGPVQKTRDGEPLSGGISAAEAFGAFSQAQTQEQTAPAQMQQTGGINPLTGMPY